MRGVAQEAAIMLRGRGLGRLSRLLGRTAVQQVT